MEAVDFVQSLLTQTQLLASLNWLCKFHVLAFIPPAGSLAVRDLADIVDVPVTHLSGVVNLAATSGFLHMPQPGYVAHTALSIQFVWKPSLLDAVGFLCETTLPAAMKLPQASRALAGGEDPTRSAYNLGTPSKLSLVDECKRQPKLARQLSAYQRIFDEFLDEGKTAVLATFDWSYGNITVVHVGPTSAAPASLVAETHPNIRFVLQPYDNGTSDQSLIEGLEIPMDMSTRFEVQRRAHGSPQNVVDATVYILHLPATSPLSPSTNLSTQITTELKVHLKVLRRNPLARLILLAPVASEPGRRNTKADALSRAYGLSLLQLGNDGLMSMAQLEGLLDTARDASGRLAIASTSVSREHFVVALHLTVLPLA